MLTLGFCELLLLDTGRVTKYWHVRMSINIHTFVENKLHYEEPPHVCCRKDR